MVRWAMRIWWISSAPSAKRAHRAWEHVGQRRVLRVAECAVHLDRTVDHPPQRVRHDVLGHRHLVAELEAVLDPIGGVQDHQLALVELDG